MRPAEADSRTPALAYVVGAFPSASQTFIVREIRTMARLGFPILVFGLRRLPLDVLEPVDRAWMERVRFVPAWPTWSVLSAHAHVLLSRPAGYFRGLRALMRLRHRPLYMYGRAAWLFLRAPWVVREIDRAGGVDQIHGHFATAQTEMALAVAAITGRPYSFTAHARDIYATPNALEQKIRGAAFVVTCTQYNADYLDGLCPGLPTGHVVRVYHGVDTRPGGTGPESAESHLQGEPASAVEPPLLLAAGRLIGKKGFDDLLAACAILRDRGTPYRCVVAGEGPLRARLEALGRRLGLEDRVALPGWQSQEQIFDLYRRAAVFVMPSKITPAGDRDGIPNTLLEALALGVPAVSTDVSGIPEVVVDGETGLLVPPGDPESLADALERILTESDTADRLARVGRERVHSEFDLLGNVGKLADLFRERPTD